MEDSIFIKLMGDSPRIRVLNFLLMFREFDYSMTDIAKESNVAWSTLCQLWPEMENLGVVVNTRTVGRAKMYKLNLENQIVKDLIRFADRIVRDYTEKKTKPVKKIVKA